jgi:serine acetyltransferase
MTRKELKRIVELETKKIYEIGFPKPKANLAFIKIVCFLTKNNRYYRARLLKAWRFYSFYKSKSSFWLLLQFFWFRVYNKYSILLNTQLGSASLGEGFVFVHQNILLTKNSVIGKNVTLLGDNCLAAGKYSPKNKSNAPILGDRVWMGYGSIAVGGVFIADDCFVGAGAVITKDIPLPGSIVIGTNHVVGNIFDEAHRNSALKWW